MKLDVEKQKTKSSTLKLAVDQANIQIKELGGGIKVAALESAVARLTKDNEKHNENHALEKTKFTAEKNILIQAKKSISDENVTLKRQGVAQEKELMILKSNRESQKQQADLAKQMNAFENNLALGEQRLRQTAIKAEENVQKEAAKEMNKRIRQKQKAQDNTASYNKKEEDKEKK